MIITKIHMKLRKEEFFDCYGFVSGLQMRVIKELEGRVARLGSEVLTVYDYAPKMINQNKLRVWENYDATKRYSFELPIGVALSLFRMLAVDPHLSKKAFTSIVFHRLINVMAPTSLLDGLEDFVPFGNPEEEFCTAGVLKPHKIVFKLESHGQQV